MGQALYRKYRSKSLDEIVGQEHITNTLKHALQSGRISHAYLFTGPKGVGKTSIARILAHEINGLPYTDDSSHMDIIEIDAASNRRIDEIRELREKVYVAPTSAKYKVYIIDEVHMLTKEAFNALLKTLEEPPAHVVFILATTDAHKLPETIISRTQRYSFKPVTAAKVQAHLREIADTEKLNVSDDALALLAEHGEGSFRDSISLLDQASSYGERISADDVRALLGIPPAEALISLLECIQAGQSISDVAQSLNALYEQGYQPAAIAQQLGRLLRHDLVEAQVFASDRALTLLTALLSVPSAHDPERYLEIVLLQQLASEPAVQASPVVATKQPVTEASVAEIIPEVRQSLRESPVPEISLPSQTKTEPKRPAAAAAVGTLDAALWPAVLDTLKHRHNTLYGVIRMAEPRFSDSGDELTLAFSFAFHQKRITEARNQQILADIIKELTGQPVRIVCIVDKGANPQPVKATPIKTAVKADELSTISNIFGGGELLES